MERKSDPGREESGDLTLITHWFHHWGELGNQCVVSGEADSARVVVELRV